MIGGSSRLKYLQQSIYHKFGKKPLVYHDLENVVSYGACLQAALLEKVYKNNSEIILVDVLPLSLGVKTADGLFSIIIPRNTPVPAQRMQKYTTSDETTVDETDIEIEVYEGIRNICKDNYLVGKFIFNIDKSISSPVIDISFEVDANGMIKISVIDKKSNNKKIVVLKKVSSQIDNETMKIYLEEAEKSIDSDLILEKQQLVYKLDNMIITIKDNLISDQVKIEDNDKENILNELDLIDENIEEFSETELLKLVKKLEDKYTNLLIVPTTEMGYIKNDKYASNQEIEQSIEFDKDRVIQKCNYYLSLTDENSILFNYLIESIEYIESINDINDLKSKEEEIINNLEKIQNKNYRDELVLLCNFLLEEINEDKIDISKNNIEELLITIKDIFNKLDTITLENNDIFENEINKLNNYCYKSKKK